MVFAEFEKLFVFGSISANLSVQSFKDTTPLLLTAQKGAVLKEVTLKPDVWGRWVEAAIGAHLVNHQLRLKLADLTKSTFLVINEPIQENCIE